MMLGESPRGLPAWKGALGQAWKADVKFLLADLGASDGDKQISEKVD